MKTIKQYWILVIIIVVTGILVILRNFSHQIFRYDAVKHAAASMSGENLKSTDQLAMLEGEILIVNLDGKELDVNTGYTQLSISSDSILISPDKELIFNHKGSIVLNSPDPSKAAAVWMVLSQMGRENIYILN